MRKNSGFTLIEIIIAIAILGVLSIGILTAFSGQFQQIHLSRDITKHIYTAQQDMEVTITEIQKAIQNGTEPEGGGKTAYTLFSGQSYARTVFGYPRTIELGDSSARTFFTVVADNRMPEFEVASVAVSITLSDGTDVANDLGRSALSIVSTIVLTDPNGVNMTSIYRWYVSRPGFNFPMIPNPQEIEKGTKYPSFPNDYMIIPAQSSANLTADLTQYTGRHIVCTVTPASKSGKMGATAVSNPVFIPGLGVTDGLRMHLDASLIDAGDSDSVRTSGAISYVKRWNDISGSNADGVQGTSSAQPILDDEKTGDFIYNDIQHEIWVKYLQFDGSNDTIYTDSLSSLNMNNATIFIVARNEGDTAFTIYNNITRPYSPSLLSIRSSSGRVYLGYNYPAGRYTACDIAEVIVYDHTLSSGEIDTVEGYLTAKYTPVPIEVSIYSLQTLTATILKGDTFTMPSTVIAYYTNGTSQSVPVTWTPSSVDSGSPGIQVFTGAVEGTEKTASLRVTVLDAMIVSLDNITETLYQNTPFIMPSFVVANLSNGSKMNVDVEWEPASVNTSAIGYQYSTGTAVADPGKTMLLTVHVIGKPVSSVSLTPASLDLYVGDAGTINATVLPDDAGNKTLSWTSSDYSVANVDDSGQVSAVAPGTAIITATAQDGTGKFASCTVTVRAINVISVSLSPTTVTLSRNGIASLTATVLPINATYKSVTWTSSDPTVATVSASGASAVITALKGGRTVVTVTTTDGAKTAACTVYVRPYALTITNLASNRFSMTFDSVITSAIAKYKSGSTTRTITGTISGTTATFYRSSGLSNATYTITAECDYGAVTITTTVIATRSGSSPNYIWTIISQS